MKEQGAQTGLLSTLGAWALALLWIMPLLYACWAAFHASEFATKLVLTAPLTLTNFEAAWDAAPFARYFINTSVLVATILAMQLFLCTLAAYAFARYEFCGKNLLFSLVLIQLTLFCLGLCYFSFETNVQNDSKRTGGGSRDGGRFFVADFASCVYSFSETGVSRFFSGVC